MIVYKYLPAYDYVFDSVLEKSRIRFTQPNLFNDPFESLPSFAEEKNQKIEFAKNDFRARFNSEITADSLKRILHHYYEELANMPATLGKTIVSLCLTQRRNNGLMWSHYADSHKGLAIGFDSDCSFFKPGNGKAKQGLKKITYSEKRESVFTRIPIEDGENELEKYFFTKSNDWVYEEEFRICAFTEFANKPIEKDRDGFEMYLYNFPPECVKEVILGFRMSKENQEKVAKIVANKFPKAELLQAVLNDSNFDLDIVPYSS